MDEDDRRPVLMSDYVPVPPYLSRLAVDLGLVLLTGPGGYAVYVNDTRQGHEDCYRHLRWWRTIDEVAEHVLSRLERVLNGAGTRHGDTAVRAIYLDGLLT